MTPVVWTLGAEADVQAIYERLDTWEEVRGIIIHALLDLRQSPKAIRRRLEDI